MMIAKSPPSKLKPLSSYRQQKYDAKQKQILDAARGIMREQGVAALTMQELANRVNLRAPSLYNYFKSKMDIYDALFRMGFTLLAQQRQRYMQDARTWQEVVRLSFEHYLTFAKENPELYQLCFERPVPGFVPSPESLEFSLSLLKQSYDQMARFQQDLHTGLSLQQAVDLLIAFMHGITAMHMANEPDLPAGQGRFGALIPPAIHLLEKAWSNP